MKYIDLTRFENLMLTAKYKAHNGYVCIDDLCDVFNSLPERGSEPRPIRINNPDAVIKVIDKMLQTTTTATISEMARFGVASRPSITKWVEVMRCQLAYQSCGNKIGLKYLRQFIKQNGAKGW